MFSVYSVIPRIDLIAVNTLSNEICRCRSPGCRCLDPNGRSLVLVAVVVFNTVELGDVSVSIDSLEVEVGVSIAKGDRLPLLLLMSSSNKE